MISIAKHLFMHGVHYIIYADDIVIFSLNKLLNIVIKDLNRALHNLNVILTRSSFQVALEKCKSVIFTRRKCGHPPKNILDSLII